ncbi:MBL fold metallo-hydrolase (plasmid) [Bacillus cereus]|uniref:MBL fold metallo-hydrolase n=1 Tax=Bacillus cereus TaxID=1396 RepID=UPI00156086BE|nr:MBL fold metallo-hydrolase [Bacillus cereus]QKH04698.1 MBL fold metallo-hydrolase [Bacillus cereus]QKH10460.1 MBL fold metallo-hydrolase [Bacillus cereus]HDR8161556.1 MBL fold metallo-hydrolase [Bacillus cereus]
MEKTYDIYPLRVCSKKIINYSYIIVDKSSRQAAIIDPAWELDTIQNKLDELGVKLFAIILTHAHYDHINLVKPLLLLHNPKVFMDEKEIEYYQFNSLNLNPIRNNEVIRLGETNITCIRTPGHTIGSCCYLLEQDCFTGDTVFIEGVGVCDLDGGCPEEMFYSIQRLKQIVPHNVRIYPGHRFGKSIGQPFRVLLKDNIYFLLEDIKFFIEFRMRKKQKETSFL